MIPYLAAKRSAFGTQPLSILRLVLIFIRLVTNLPFRRNRLWRLKEKGMLLNLSSSSNHFSSFELTSLFVYFIGMFHENLPAIPIRRNPLLHHIQQPFRA